MIKKKNKLLKDIQNEIEVKFLNKNLRKTKMIQENVKIYWKQAKNNQHGNNRSPWISNKARETEQTLKTVIQEKFS